MSLKYKHFLARNDRWVVGVTPQGRKARLVNNRSSLHQEEPETSDFVKYDRAPAALPGDLVLHLQYKNRYHIYGVRWCEGGYRYYFEELYTAASATGFIVICR